jgi:hypothetical protein
LLKVIELKLSQGSGADQQPVGSRQIDNSGAHGGQAGGWLRIFMLCELVILSLSFYNPRTTIYPICRGERSESR